MSNISFDPYKTQGNFSGSFNISSNGFIQGDAQDDPAIRLQLCQGVLDSGVTSSVYGGIGVIECVPKEADSVQGSDIKIATTTICNAFLVSNQAYHGISTPSSPVPLFPAGSSVHYYRLGSHARIPLKISSAVAALAASNTDVSNEGVGFVWDVTNNQVDVYSSATSGNPKVAIRLLKVSSSGNLVVSVDGSGNAKWVDQPCGLFEI
ncbi:hypothetical protein [Mangrovibacter phragmitis]|uniref:hypothetical protein n=1 Tax=Mangrovibacter phragmitis TaxID=1691903 RepID=UPI00336A0D7E